MPPVVIILNTPFNTISKISSAGKPLAVILGKYATTGLGVCRCFGTERIPTLWIDANKRQVGFLSRYCTASLTCPHPKEEKEAYVDYLIEVGENLPQKGVLFPLGDIELMALLKSQKKLQQYYHFSGADFSVTHLLLNKKKFYETLARYQVPHPFTFFPQRESDIASLSKEMPYPCILKPVDSESFRVAFNTKFLVAHSRQELLEKYKTVLSKQQEVVIQEIVPGDARHMYGFNAYYDRSFAPHGICMFRRLREWPPLSGNGVCIEHASLPESEPLVSSLMKKIQYHGIVDVELKYDPRDNTYKFIEINPRCWMQVTFPLSYGNNIPYLAYLDALGKPLNTHIPSATKATWALLLQDIPAALRRISHGNLTFREWICSYKGKMEYGIFSWDDPLPFVGRFPSILSHLSHY